MVPKSVNGTKRMSTVPLYTSVNNGTTEIVPETNSAKIMLMALN